MIFHIVRTTANLSPFKEIIQESLHSGIADRVYISSGFFQEATSPFSKKSYSASSDPDQNGNSFVNYKNSCGKKGALPQIITKGTYSGQWWPQYQAFVTSLKSAGFTVKSFQVVRHHAKVFILEKNRNPFLEIIGSSNFTSRAYGTGKFFNQEADLVISTNRKVTSIINKILVEPEKEEFSVIRLAFSPQNDFSLINQMKWIRDHIF